MQAEQVEIAQFLVEHPPFDTLESEALNELAMQIEVAYFRAQTDILHLGQDIVSKSFGWQAIGTVYCYYY